LKKKNVLRFPQNYQTAQLKYLLCIKQYLILSEGSCDTEDWSNGSRKLHFAITGIDFKTGKILHCLFICQTFGKN